MNRIYRKADIDVVVLTYNHALYIDRNIRSILGQKTKYSFNVLIADDCSTDGSRELIQGWVEKDERVFLVGTSKNVGSVENARNVISYCQSDYLALCEGDDFWIDPNKLQTQLDFLKEHPDYGMVHGDVSYFYQGKNQLGGSANKSQGVIFPTGFIFEQYLTNKKLFIYTATVMIHRELFIRSTNYDLFNERGWLAQDLPTWLELSQHTKIGYIDRVLSGYRLANESASRSVSSEYIHQFHQSVFQIRYYYWERYSGKEELKSKLDYMYSLSLLADLRLLRSMKIWRELVTLKRKRNFSWELKRWMQFLYLSLLLLIKRR